MVGLFLIIWGLLFGGLPLIAYINAQQNGVEGFPIIIVYVFLVVGFIAFSLGIYNVYCKFRRKHIARTGVETLGYYLDMHSNFSSNGISYYYINYYYLDANGKRHEQKSGAIFKFNQACYFETLNKFKIRYKGNRAVITEPLDFNAINKISREIISPTRYRSVNVVPKVKEKEYLTCDYCGYVQDEPGRCICCGARINIKIPKA